MPLWARRLPRRWLGKIAGVLFVACGGATPVVPSGPHPPGVGGIRVGFPPPPARVEALPLQRRDECKWRDGHWQWASQKWIWVEGSWVIPPPGCFYAPPRIEWMRRGGGPQLVHWPPRWYPDPKKNPNGVCVEPRACASLLPEGAP